MEKWFVKNNETETESLFLLTLATLCLHEKAVNIRPEKINAWKA